MQKDLGSIYDWTKQNKIKFNEDKFELLIIGKHKELQNNTSYFTPGYSELIEQEEHLRDLGLELNDDLSFKTHIAKTVSTVKQKSGWILCSIVSRESLTLKRLWKTYVLPSIDYCSVLWFSLERTGEVKELESLQYNFLPNITGHHDKKILVNPETLPTIQCPKKV